MSMNDVVGTTLIVSLGWIVSLCLHEFGHAVIAFLGGDKSVKEKGYLTLNPLKYTDPGLTLAFPLIFLLLGGVALPGAAVYIDHKKLNRVMNSLVSLAGPAANVCCLIAIALIFKFALGVPNIPNWLLPSLALLAELETVSIILNLLPIPPLDGFGIIEPWLPVAVRDAARRNSNYGFLIVFSALWFIQPLNQALWGTARNINQMLEIPQDGLYETYETFRQGSVFLFALILIAMWLAKRKKPQSTI